MEIEEVLKVISPHAILVGSAAKCSYYHDLDFVISVRGFKIFDKLTKKMERESVFPFHWKLYEFDIPIEVFVVWYGPLYEKLKKSDRLKIVQYNGVSLRAVDINTF